MAKKNNIKTAVKKPAQSVKLPAKNTGKNKLSAHLAELSVTTDEPTVEPISEELSDADAIETTVYTEPVYIVADTACAEQADAVSFENTDSAEPEKGNIVSLDATDSTETFSAEPLKSRKPRLGTDITHKLVGCSYHYFRRFFKKPFNSANIKVRFVKGGMGYNGHMEIAEATKEQSLTLLEKIKLDNPLIKNIYWDLVSE